MTPKRAVISVNSKVYFYISDKKNSIKTWNEEISEKLKAQLTINKTILSVISSHAVQTYSLPTDTIKIYR